jgi:hypothetical protein
VTDLDRELAEHCKANRLSNINSAIWYWQEKKTPNRFWWDKAEYTPEYCDTQIAYFEAMKKETL